MATYVGPYFVIILAASTGAAWSLGRMEETTKLKAFNYFVLMVFTALIFTVPLSEWVGGLLKWDDSKLLFAPVALLIGGVGGDWPSLLKWLGARVMRMIERKSEGGQ